MSSGRTVAITSHLDAIVRLRILTNSGRHLRRRPRTEEEYKVKGNSWQSSARYALQRHALDANSDAQFRFACANVVDDAGGVQYVSIYVKQMLEHTFASP